MEENVVNTTVNTNFTGSVLDTFNHIFRTVFLSIDDTIYSLLDELAFIKENILENDLFEKLIDKTSGILLICNALILGVIIFYSINYLFSHLFISKIDSPSQFIFKLIVFTIVMNSSFWICEQIINIVSIITEIIQDIGKSLFSEDITFSNFLQQINSKLYSGEFEITMTSFDGIIKSFISVSFVNLAFSYSLRYVMVQVFVIISPFAFLCLINNKTEWFFKVWIKTFLSFILEQILIIFILLIAFSLDGLKNDISKILYIGIMYALMKTNNYMYMMFGGISTTVQQSINNMKMFNGKL